MTALVSINQGTAPAGSDGDTVRAAFTKVNANTAVLQAQATLTNYPTLVSGGDLTAAHVGKRVNINGSSVGLPPASAAGVDGIITIRNAGTVACNVWPGGGNPTAPQAPIFLLNVGESATFDTDGASPWRLLMRGRSSTNNETVNGTLTVGGAITAAGGVTGNLAATGKVAGVNNPNLLLNGSAEFGMLGWAGQFLANLNDNTGATGSSFYCPALTGATLLQTSANILVGAGVPLTLSSRMSTGGMTAGLFSMRLEAFDSSNASKGYLCVTSLSPGSGWTYKYASGTTPTGTAYVKAEFFCDGSPAGAAFAANIQQIKVELGTAPSSYSQEASIAYPQVPATNLLINARGRVNTRTYASGAATTAAKQYTVDRWRVLTSGQSLSWTDDGYARTFTAPAGGVEQIVGGSNMPGGAFCLSWTGTAAATVNGTSIANGGTVALPVGTNVSVVFSNGTFRLPNLQPGTYNSGVDFVDDDTERTRCLKYCRIIKADTEGWGGSSQNAIITFNFDQMRATPAASLAYKTTPSYGGSVGSPPTWNVGDRYATMTVALSATVGAWYVVGYDVLLDAEINT